MARDITAIAAAQPLFGSFPLSRDPPCGRIRKRYLTLPLKPGKAAENDRLLHGRGRDDWEAARLPMEAANLDFFEEERGRRDGAGNPVFDHGTKRAKRRAGESVLGVLQIVVDHRVVANSHNVAQRANGE